MKHSLFYKFKHPWVKKDSEKNEMPLVDLGGTGEFLPNWKFV